ncbi:MAG TPA: hypothetical protein VHZ76_09135 [Gammaproteobacteria bacterium]|nr:hypothetical protein [Gammaproteobacteria bacterium]
MQQPEAYVSHVDQLFDGDANIKTEETRKFLQAYMDAYAKWVEKIVR